MDKIEEFLLTGVPGSTKTSATGLIWSQRAKDLGPSAPERFIEALRNGHWIMHYAAVLGLRIHGWQSQAAEDESGEYFQIKAPEEPEWTNIRPKYVQDMSRYTDPTPELYVDELRYGHWILHEGAIYRLEQDGYEVKTIRTDFGDFSYKLSPPYGPNFEIRPDFVPPAEKVNPGAWLWGKQS